MIFSLFEEIGMGLISGRDAVFYLIVILLAIMVSITIHEFAHAFVAYKFGDDTPKLTGRLTLNPFHHIDAFGFLSFVIIGVGWAKPVQTNPLNYKKFKTGRAWVSVAGVIANYILVIISAFVCALIMKFVGAVNEFVIWIYIFFAYLLNINAFLIVFNLIPLYPLDGFNFISAFLKPDSKFIRWNYSKGYKTLLIVLLVGVLIDILFGLDLISLVLNFLSNLISWPWVTLFSLI